MYGASPYHMLNPTASHAGKTFETEHNQGKKSDRAWAELRRISDELCKENNLSVIEHPEEGKGLKKKNGSGSLLYALRAVCICEINHSVTYLQSRWAVCNNNNCLVGHTPEILEQTLFRICIESRSRFIKEQYRAF